MKLKAESPYYFMILSVIMIAAFGLLSLNTQWSDSEIWAIAISKEFLQFSDTTHYYKPLFNLILSLLHEIPLSNLDMLYAARVLFFLIAAGTVYGFYQLGKLVSQSKMAAAWSTLLLVTSTYFISQGFKVRSDVLATGLQIWGLVFFLKAYHKLDRDRLNLALSLLFHLLLLLATPKGILHLIINFFVIGSNLDLKASRLKAKMMYLWTLVGLTPIFFGLIWVINPEAVTSPLEFFFNSYRESQYHPGFWSQQSAQHWLRWFVENWHLCLLSLTILLCKKPQGEFLSVQLGFGVVIAIAISFFNSDRLPFFVYSMSLIPILFLGLYSFEFIFKRSYSHMLGKYLIFFTLPALMFVKGIFYVYEMSQEADNEIQVESVLTMERYLVSHGLPKYYDGVGVLSRMNQSLALPSPQHSRGLQQIINILNDPELKVVFFSTRMFYFFESLYQALEERFFIEVGPGVFVRSYVMRSTPSVSLSEWSHVCRKLNWPTSIQVFEGNGFLKMRWAFKDVSCEDPPKFKPGAEFLAFTEFRETSWPRGRSFAEIFDHNPLY